MNTTSCHVAGELGRSVGFFATDDQPRKYRLVVVDKEGEAMVCTLSDKSARQLAGVIAGATSPATTFALALETATE